MPYMSSSSSSPPPSHCAETPSTVDALHKDHALPAVGDFALEAAPSYDFLLFPDDPIPVLSSSPTPSSETRLTQNVAERRKPLRDEVDRAMLPLQKPHRRKRYLPALDPLPPQLSSAAAAQQGRPESPDSDLAYYQLVPKPQLGRKGLNGARSPAIHQPQPRRLRGSPTHAATNSVLDTNRVNRPFPSSPPPAPRIGRLPTPDLVPMDARAFCKCCTTSVPRERCELCRNVQRSQRDLDLLGVGSIFD